MIRETAQRHKESKVESQKSRVEKQFALAFDF
jgi:hypothetical protein